MTEEITSFIPVRLSVEFLKLQKKIYENADLWRMTVNTNDIISVKEYEIVFSFIANN